jgi:hypothetical protein
MFTRLVAARRRGMANLEAIARRIARPLRSAQLGPVEPEGRDSRVSRVTWWP